MVEMTVSNVELTKLPPDVGADLETCVLLRLFENIEMEVCDCDLGSIGNLKSVARGENCIFSLANDWDVASVNASISVFKKDVQDKRFFIGRYDLHLEEIFKKLMKEHKSIVLQSKDAFKRSAISAVSSNIKEFPDIHSSVKSLKSESINTDAFPTSSEIVSETIKGLFPLFNHDDDNIGFIVLTLRISCYGNMILQPKIVASQVSRHKTPDIFLGQKPSTNVDSAPDLYHLCMYKKSKNEGSGGSSVSCVCHEPCLADDAPALNQSEECIAMPPPSPVESCVRQSSENYDEYIQEINGNSLTIRIAKGARLRAQILEPDDDIRTTSCLKDVIKYSRDQNNVTSSFKTQFLNISKRLSLILQVTIEVPQNNQLKPKINVYSDSKCTCSTHPSANHTCVCPISTTPKSVNHCSKLPVVKGNLKYPNRLSQSCNLNVDIQDCRPGTNPLEQFRVGNERNRNFCMQTCDYGIRNEQENAKVLHMSKVIRPSVKKDENEQDTKRKSAEREGKEKRRQSMSVEKDEDLGKLKKQCPKGIEVISCELLK